MVDLCSGEKLSVIPVNGWRMPESRGGMLAGPPDFGFRRNNVEVGSLQGLPCVPAIVAGSFVKPS
jgi:hypothetical protein